MKKLLIALPVALCIGLVSCNDKGGDKGGGGMSDAAKKNLESMHGIQKCFETKDFSKIGDYIAADAVDHSGMTGEIKGIDSLKAQFERMSAMTEGDKSEVIKELADDEYVMSWNRYTGTAKVSEMGMKAGDKISMEAIEVAKFNKEGKATDHWSMMTMNECMKMMPPGAPKMDEPMKDTTKKMDAIKK